MSDADSLEDLRQQSENTDRVSAATDEQSSLEDDLLDHITGVKEGDEATQVGVRDSRLVALANTLDEREDDYDEVVSGLEEVVESTPDLQAGTKSYLLALLARAGLQECAPDVLDEVEGAVAEYAKREL